MQTCHVLCLLQGGECEQIFGCFILPLCEPVCVLMKVMSCIMVCMGVRLFVIFLLVTGPCQHIHGKDIWLHVQ